MSVTECLFVLLHSLVTGGSWPCRHQRLVSDPGGCLQTAQTALSRQVVLRRPPRAHERGVGKDGLDIKKVERGWKRKQKKQISEDGWACRPLLTAFDDSYATCL